MQMTKRYTLEEANLLLPHVMDELKELQQLSRKLESQYMQYQLLKSKGTSVTDDPLFELEGRIDFMQMEMKLSIENFTRRGILLKMIEPGLVDFPAVVQGEEVLLCWKEGEERITHYHGWEDGYAGRRLHPEA